MKHIIDVNTGQVHLGKDKVTLRSLAIGSCVAVAAYDSINRIGAIAHIMLPGKAPEKALEKTRYAIDAIEEMLDMMLQAGTEKSSIETCLVGAGNVLKKKDDTICAANIESVTQLLDSKNIPIRATSLGGNERKSIFLDVESGVVSCAIGDGKEEDLWKPTVL